MSLNPVKDNVLDSQRSTNDMTTVEKNIKPQNLTLKCRFSISYKNHGRIWNVTDACVIKAFFSSRLYRNNWVVGIIY